MSEEVKEVIETEDGSKAVIGATLDSKVTEEYNDSEIQVLEGLEKDLVCILLLLHLKVYIILFGKS